MSGSPSPLDFEANFKRKLIVDAPFGESSLPWDAFPNWLSNKVWRIAERNETAGTESDEEEDGVVITQAAPMM